ncbi:DUF5680 domain-containing protein [Anaerosacchariphilus polymeriproducens]|uniref:XRE family transcriptional regulator n=1 Tax=Anaerosacchariphilus polymeriproducens TaxID=1812858 RepID=A0A371ASS3_9FIRM|nr:DUF5680 domain-containing protein [Anaerosacchariphilus polymeriproducens]RDU22599.1 XRE family transcriptional regulator [Anaerosacchariphilus polymeriproducens]
MKLEEKLQILRKKNGYSQEQLADKIGISRQTISKWENGQAVPELAGLILLSDLYGVTIDRIVKDNDKCNTLLRKKAEMDINEIVTFLICAKRNTYAGKGNEVKASRLSSHDFSYRDNGFLYYDTYLGGEKFSGEEAVWHYENPIWSMNYTGRVIGEHFNGDFLKDALMNVPANMPYRGPEIFTKGDYHYHCIVEGEFVWFQGYEEIFYLDKKVFECYFHGGKVE